MKGDISLTDIKQLKYSYINQRVTFVEIEGYQDPAVMEELFSLLSNSSVRSLDIISYNISTPWMEHVKKIGHCLRHLSIRNTCKTFTTFKTLTEYCPYLEKLNLGTVSHVTDSNILQTIAQNCSQLRSLAMWFSYPSNTEADADLTAFAEKCPQL